MSLDDPRPLLLADPIAEGLALRILRFDPRQYVDADFARHGVTLPSALNRASRARRCEFLAGRRCAHAALESLDYGRPDIPIGHDGAPDWPTDCNGSISHSAYWAAAVVSGGQCTRPGVDCESIVDDSAFRDMAGLVTTEGELESAERALGDRHLALTLLFSAKESAFKALRPEDRAGCDFSSFRIALVGAGSSTFQVSDIRPSRQTCIYRGHYMHLDPTTLFTVVVSNDELPDPDCQQTP